MNRADPIVAGCVVLYECDIDLAANIASYVHDLDMLVVIDNSAVPDPRIAAVVAPYKNAEYVFNGANIGIAAALNLATNWARSRGADYLLTMDQDSSFDNSAFSHFLDRVLSLPFLEKLAVAAPGFLDKASPSPPIIDSTTVITSGSIVSLANQDRIGPFDEALFIDDVDHDYCLRAIDLELRIVTLPDFHLQHRLGSTISVRLFGKNIQWSIHSPIRHYYIARNTLYMTSKHFKRHPIYSLRRLASVIRTISVAMILAPDRHQRFGMVVQGISDYLSSRMGARNSNQNVERASNSS